MYSIIIALKGQDRNSQETLWELDIFLRQHAAKQHCLLVRLSLSWNDPSNFTDISGGDNIDVDNVSDVMIRTFGGLKILVQSTIRL